MPEPRVCQGILHLNMKEVLPNFFIVGAPKAGTTSLYHSLDRHPQIYISPVKEPCYFASEIRPENFSEEHAPRIRREAQDLREYLNGPIREKRFSGVVSDWDDYLKLFQDATEKTAIGEASVCYLWSPTAAQNIISRIPNAKIIIILRDPAERAFSQYLHTVTAGLVHNSFREQVEQSVRSPGGKFDVFHPFLELGLYYQQVKRYLDLFPKQNLRIYFYQEHAEMVPDILRFLNVDSSLAPAAIERHLEARVPRALNASYFLKKTGVWQGAKRITPQAFLPLLRRTVFQQRKDVAMDTKDRQYLIAYYRDDIARLSTLLDRDLTAWMT